MDLKTIKALLEKFYSGVTSLDEEKILRDYFTGNQVSDELIADKDIFLFQTSEQNEIENLPDFTNEIWANITNNVSNKEFKKNNLTYYILRIAAGIIVIIGFLIFFKDQKINVQKDIQFTDTYNNPEVAYKQAKETLLYVSAMLNRGTSHLEPIQKINNGTKELNKLKSFNDGLKELDPLIKYNVASKYLK